MGGKRLGSRTRPTWTRSGLTSQSLGRCGTKQACAAGPGRATATHPTAEAEQAGWPDSGADRSQGTPLTGAWSIRASQCDIPAGELKAAIAGAAPRSERTVKTIMICLRMAALMSTRMAQGCQSFNHGHIYIVLTPAGKQPESHANPWQIAADGNAVPFPLTKSPPWSAAPALWLNARCSKATKSGPVARFKALIEAPRCFRWVG